MATYSFSFFIDDYNAPFVLNLSPTDQETGIDGYTIISFDLLDDYSGVDVNTIDIIIDGSSAFTSPSTFVSPWNGIGSSISPTTVDGYDGYHFVLVGTELLSPRTIHNIRIQANDNNSNSLDQNTTFITGTSISGVSVGTYEINLVVTFSHDMKVDSELINPANYTFDNGMYARNASIINSKNILLEVEKFHTFDEFKLTVGNKVTDDSYGDPLPESYNKFDFSPFKSDANISNYNAKIRTWHHSSVVQADSERIYVAGTRGIDVFRKENPTRPVRWAQILDEYGAQAMFVMNYPDELVITDNVPPLLDNQNPEPNSTVPSVSSIELTITDINTAVEPTAVTIYVNEIIVFAGGYGGWSNNYSGRIDVGYKELNFTLTPPVSFSLGQIISVRVIATDLLGNRLDGTYQFSIGTSAIIEGWGGGNWGSYDSYGIGELLPWGGWIPWV